MAFDRCPCSGRTLGRLVQPALMAILAEGPIHGYRLARRAAAMALFHGEEPDLTGVYRVLRAMERGGLVAAAWDVSQPGPAKRLYRLTPRGRACLDEWVGTLQVYQRAIRDLVRTAQRAGGGRRRSPRRASALA